MAFIGVTLGASLQLARITLLFPICRERPVRTDCIHHHAFRRLWRFPVVVEKGLELAGLLYDRVVSETADLWVGAVLTHFSPPWKSRFPATETAVARDSVRKGSYCAGSPSIWCWRDHSAGRSARRITPMPCGSRPSIAALTRSGARKASEIVILTSRTRTAMRSDRDRRNTS
jgi:hypothetical protein